MILTRATIGNNMLAAALPNRSFFVGHSSTMASSLGTLAFRFDFASLSPIVTYLRLGLIKSTFLSLLLAVSPLLADTGIIEKYLRPCENKSDDHGMRNIDFIYVINLDKRPQKFARTRKVLAPYGISPYRFSAVNGWELSFEALEQLGVKYAPGLPEGPIASVYRHEDGVEYISFEIMKEAGVSYYCHSLSRGAIGCILSHLSVLQDAYDSGYQTIWVMEDDIKIVRNPYEISSLIDTLDQLAPDWDVLFTDYESKSADGTPFFCGSIRPRPYVQLQSHSYYYHRVNLNADLLKLGLRFGAYSMVVRRAGMKKILDYFKANQIYFPYDIDYRFVPGIQMYSSSRDIVTNIPGAESDNGTPSYESESLQ